MKCFKYDALLLTDKEKWQGHVLDEIRKDYKKMLDAGATSVWETSDYDAKHLSSDESRLVGAFYFTFLRKNSISNRL